MKTPSLLALALSLACASPALAAPDEKLKAAAEAAQPALIETLHEMVLIESGSGDVEGLAKMADFTEARLKALGARTERRKTTRGDGAKPSLEIAPHEAARWDELRAVRARLAREQSVPAYVIFHDATLVQMLRERPQTLDDLAKISGVGAAKLAKYGEAFLAVLRSDV